MISLKKNYSFYSATYLLCAMVTDREWKKWDVTEISR